MFSHLQIRFTGRKGQNGDLALDDIFILPDSCDEPVITEPPPTEMRKFHKLSLIKTLNNYST